VLLLESYQRIGNMPARGIRGWVSVHIPTYDLGPRAAALFYRPWLCDCCHAASHDLVEACIVAFKEVELIRALVRRIPFWRRHLEGVARLEEHNRLLTEAATEGARKLQEREAEFAEIATERAYQVRGYKSITVCSPRRRRRALVSCKDAKPNLLKSLQREPGSSKSARQS